MDVNEELKFFRKLKTNIGEGEGWSGWGGGGQGGCE